MTHEVARSIDAQGPAPGTPGGGEVPMAGRPTGPVAPLVRRFAEAAR